MWRPCPVVLDEPVKFFGLELEDFAFAAATPVLTMLFLDTMWCFGSGLAVGLALYLTKRGRLPGGLMHTLHDWEVMPLPGILSPREKVYSPWPHPTPI